MLSGTAGLVTGDQSCRCVEKRSRLSTASSCTGPSHGIGLAGPQLELGLGLLSLSSLFCTRSMLLSLSSMFRTCQRSTAMAATCRPLNA